MAKKSYLLLLTLCFYLCCCSKNNAEIIAGTAEVQSLDAAFTQVATVSVAGSPYESNLYLPYGGGNGAAFERGASVASTGVTGLTATLQKGQLEKGYGSLVYQVSGVPSQAGTASFALSFGGKTSTVQLNVKEKTNSSQLYWGFFDDSGTPMSFYNGFGKKPSMAMMFNGWTANGNRDFPSAFCAEAQAAGYVPHVTWEPMMGLEELMSGKYDADIKRYGEALAKFGKPVVLRFAHEFNGDWYPWSIQNDQLVPVATYIKAFRYVHDKVRAAGGTNARWAWAPNNANGNKNPQTVESYYPGDAYVDLIGMDGYNFGTSQSWSSWQSFAQVFGPLYNRLSTAYPNKPIFIAEMGCSSTGGDKAVWIKDMFAQLETQFPKIKTFVWFNINKETDWRFTNGQSAIDAFKTGLSNPRVDADPTLGGVIK